MPQRSPHILVAIAALILFASSAAPAQTSVFLEELTSPELAQRIATGATTILVPIGGTEQNGPHIALGKHNVRVRMLAERIGRSLGQTMVAPVLAYVPEGSIDPATAHMRQAGTISIPEPVFERVIEYAARSFKRHGFRDIVLLGDHGGYQQSLAAVANRLNREWSGTRVRVHAIVEYYAAAGADYAKLLRERGFAPGEIGTHAGLADTSLTLALAPELVRVEALRSSSGADAEGVVGDPSRATAELGQAGVEAIVATTVAAIRRARAQRR